MCSGSIASMPALVHEEDASAAQKTSSSSVMTEDARDSAFACAFRFVGVNSGCEDVALSSGEMLDEAARKARRASRGLALFALSVFSGLAAEGDVNGDCSICRPSSLSLSLSLSVIACAPSRAVFIAFRRKEGGGVSCLLLAAASSASLAAVADSCFVPTPDGKHSMQA